MIASGHLDKPGQRITHDGMTEVLMWVPGTACSHLRRKSETALPTGCWICEPEFLGTAANCGNVRIALTRRSRMIHAARTAGLVKLHCGMGTAGRGRLWAARALGDASFAWLATAGCPDGRVNCIACPNTACSLRTRIRPYFLCRSPVVEQVRNSVATSIHGVLKRNERAPLNIHETGVRDDQTTRT